MPFVAKNKKTGERIDITQIRNPKAEIGMHDCICQYCGGSLTIRSGHYRSGYYVSQHFMHKGECDSDYEGHPESGEHLFGKLYLRSMLATFYKTIANVEINLEVPIPMSWRAKGRIADLMVVWPMGWREVHEIQLASITPDILQERTDDYFKAGIDVTWWLGGRANTATNRDWCIGLFGESYSISIERERQNHNVFRDN